MCLYIKNVKCDSIGDAIPLIARKDIICYKRLKPLGHGYFKTPYREFTVKIGTFMSVDSFGLSVDSFGLWFNQVNRGIHGYTSKKRASGETDRNEVMVKCIIPKGTEYFRGVYDDIVALKMKLKKIIYRNGKFI